MTTVEKKYTELVKTPSDINEHLIVLRYYADQCHHITELGVRKGVSTWAFLASMAEKVVSVDVNHPEEYGGSLKEMKEAAFEEDTDFEFLLANDMDIFLEETDMIFFDTLHTYNQLKKELALHAVRSRKYLVFHDTISYKDKGIDGGEGIRKAIDEFLEEHEEWMVHEVYNNNNGLMILQRCTQ